MTAKCQNDCCHADFTFRNPKIVAQLLCRSFIGNQPLTSWQLKRGIPEFFVDRLVELGSGISSRNDNEKSHSEMHVRANEHLFNG